MLYAAIYEISQTSKKGVCLCGMLGCCCGMVWRIIRDYDVYEKNRGEIRQQGGKM